MSSPRRSWPRCWGESRAAAEDMASLAHELEVNLPGTRAAFRAGILGQRKAAIIASATAVLDPAQARAAEALVLGRAGTLTPPGLRGAIARAVLEVAPKKPSSAGSMRRSRPGWNGGPRRRGTRGWPGGNCPPRRSSPPTSGSPPGPRNSARPGRTAGWTPCGPGPTWTYLLGMDSRPLGAKPGGTRETQPQLHP